jgi:hypothetical protein
MWTGWYELTACFQPPLSKLTGFGISEGTQTIFNNNYDDTLYLSI